MEVLQEKSMSSGDPEANARIKTTAQGIPLVPQPSDDPEDPLVRSLSSQKLLINDVLTVEGFPIELEPIHQNCSSYGPRVRIIPGQILGHVDCRSTELSYSFYLLS